jgi:hypothetical protein
MNLSIHTSTLCVTALIFFFGLSGQAQQPPRQASKPVKFSVSSVDSKPILQPVDGASTPDFSTSPALLGESIWTSTTDGRDFKVRIDGDSIHAEWVNLPQALKKSSAFLRSELKKNGDKWIGQTTAYLPFDYQHDATKTIWCRVQADIEIDEVSASRIEGKSQLPTSFSAKKCQLENAEWKPFVWIAKSKYLNSMRRRPPGPASTPQSVSMNAFRWL